MRITRHLLNLCFVALAFSACADAETETESSAMAPVQFSAFASGIGVSNAANTRTGGSNADPIVIRSISDLKDKDITLLGSEYQNSATQTWSFMDNWKATVKESGGNYVFDYATVNGLKYYSPQNGMKYDFKAVHPLISTGSNAGLSWGSGGFPLVNVKLEYAPDLMLAEVAGVSKPAVQTSIPLEFKHQLVLIRFNILKEVAPIGTPSHNVYVNKISTKGRLAADFNLMTKQLTPATAQTDFTIKDLGSPYSSFLVEETSKEMLSWFVFSADGDVAAEQYTFSFVINGIENKVDLPKAGKKWDLGMEYIYNLKVVGSDVYIEVDGGTGLDQEKWEDLDGSDEIIEGI